MTTAIDDNRGSGAAAGPHPFAAALAAEWTKLWSVRAVYWGLLAAAVMMVATSGQLAIYVENSNTSGDPAEYEGPVTVGLIAAQAMELTQFAIIALAMLVITTEYATGTIRTTLQCTPSRGRMLLAKATVVGAVTAVAGAALGALGAAMARPVLGRWALVEASEVTGDVLAMSAYVGLISVFALGVAAASRRAVPALTGAFLLLGIVPSVLRTPGVDAMDRIADALPGEAGMNFLRGETEAYPPAVGLVWLVAWAAAALIAGHQVLRRRDA